MASKDLNKVMLIGRLGQDPEFKYTNQGGIPVATFNIATNTYWKDDSGNLQERTDWHRVVAWRKLAELSNEWLRKGKRVYIEGRLQTRSFEQDGQKKFVTEVIATDMILIDFKDAAPKPIDASDSLSEDNSDSIANDGLPF